MKLFVKGIVILCVFCGAALAQAKKFETAQTAAAARANTLVDSRDGKKYRTVKIGGNTWMAENLNYKTGKSWCCANKESYAINTADYMTGILR